MKIKKFLNHLFSKKKIRLFFDIDGCLAVYNFDAKHEDLYRPGYFAERPLHENIIQAMMHFSCSEEYEVFSLTGYLKDKPTAVEEKEYWQAQYLPFLDAAHRLYIPCGIPKGRAIPEYNHKTDILIDDYGFNCANWAKTRGTYIKVSRNEKDLAKESYRHEFLIAPDMEPNEIVKEIGRATKSLA